MYGHDSYDLVSEKKKNRVPSLSMDCACAWKELTCGHDCLTLSHQHYSTQQHHSTVASPPPPLPGAADSGAPRRRCCSFIFRQDRPSSQAHGCSPSQQSPRDIATRWLAASGVVAPTSPVAALALPIPSPMHMVVVPLAAVVAPSIYSCSTTPTGSQHLVGTDSSSRRKRL